MQTAQADSRIAVERRKADAEEAARIDRSLDACWKEGVAAQVMFVILDYYLIPYALLLGASTREIGLLVSVPHLLGAASQFLAVRAVRWAGDRRRFLVLCCAVQTAALLPLALLGLYAFPGRMGVMLSAASVFRVLANLLGPAWGSLISDYLPETRRGQYLGWRSQIVGLSGVAGLLLSGAFLAVTGRRLETAAFAALFLAAAAFRGVSTCFMARLCDLPMHRSKDSEFTFWMFIRRVRESNFVRFALYVAGITFATQVAAPYTSVYMLRDLGFGYAGYTAVQLSSMVAGLALFPAWGRHADLVGNAKILKFTSFLIPLVPLFWAFARNPLQLVLVEFFGGIVWGGFNLCATNFVYDAVTPSKRVRCLGYFNLITSVSLFAGASLGGFLAERLPAAPGGSRLVPLFLLSAALRLAADLFLSRGFREVRSGRRKVKSARLFLSVVGARPLTGQNVEWEIFPTLKKFVPRGSKKPAEASA